MIELTLEQRQAVIKQDENPPLAINPDTEITYVLIRQEVYAKIKFSENWGICLILPSKKSITV